ncbi:MAG: leucine-rich repeat protein [Lachnospiraceae bacterium]|nr:leucine-rich repeat protein [Lachnospiraceae bacterium]
MRIKKVLLYILAAAVALSFSGGGTDRAWADETAFLNNAPDPPSPDTEEQQKVEEQTAIEEKFSTDELPDEILQDVMAAAPETGEVPEETSGEEYSRLLAKKNQVYNAGDSKLTIVKETPSDKKDFTLMVYMIGSNLESLRGSASKDILEMLDSGVGYENFNLILYTGGSTRWNSDVPCDRNCVLDLSRKEGERIVASTEKNADMGAPETLSGFINFCTKYYPAGNYGLVFWDHGGGPLWGYGSDELFEGDGLLLSEMYEAMSDTMFAAKKKLSFVGFDACLMGSLENMLIWRRFADYYVGSEELEPGDGWDYSFLKIFNESIDPVTVVSAIIDSYEAYYREKRSDFYNPDLTISAADLSKATRVSGALEEAAKYINDEWKSDTFKALHEARTEAKSFGRAGTEDGYSYDLVDVRHLFSLLEGIPQEDKERFMSAVSSLIIKSYSNVENANGVTVYYPLDNKNQFNKMRGTYEDISVSAQYTAMLKKAEKDARKEGTGSISLGTPVPENGEYILTIPDEYKDRIASASYTLLSPVNNGTYFPIMSRCTTPIDENGKIHIDSDPELIALTTGTGSFLWPVEEIENGNKRVLYQTQNTRLLSTGISYYERLSSDAVSINAVLSLNKKTNDISIRTVSTTAEGVLFGGKETVDVSSYDSIFYYYREIVPAWDADGSLLPLSLWREGDFSGSLFECIDDSFGFGLKNASECGPLYLVITVEDYYGNESATEPVLLEPETANRTVTLPTDAGVLTFTLYDDHAAVTDYVGYDTEIDIPSEAEGLPVTKIGDGVFGKFVLYSINGHTPAKAIHLPDTLTSIGNYAFRNCVELESLELPAGLTEIGEMAFENCVLLENVEIPDTVEKIGPYAFAKCTALKTLKLPENVQSIGKGLTAMCDELEEIILPGTNDSYMVVEGVLYGKIPEEDSLRLIAYPASLPGSYRVCEGTKIISSDAFASSRLSEVILPEGLERIENYAFYNTPGLHAPAFPDSLKSIGKYAFGAEWNMLTVSDRENVTETIHIGPEVSYIGDQAFAGFPQRRFEVSEENIAFSEKGGSLLNKAGDAIFEFSSEVIKVFVVPEGCVCMDLSILEQFGMYDRFDNDDPLEVYLPDSVIRFTGSTIFAEDTIMHCHEGSRAEELAEEYGFTVSYDMEPAIRDITLQIGDGQVRFKIYETYSAWVGYEGTDEEIVIPEEVEGLPVTCIGNGMEAIEDTSYGSDPSLVRVVLPDTVENIRANAFYRTDVTEMKLPDGIRILGDNSLNCDLVVDKLPDSLEDIGFCALGSFNSYPDGLEIPMSIQRIAPGAFALADVSEYIMDEGSDYCFVDNGMLFSAEGRILLAGTVPEDGNVVIPEGTLLIGAYSFYRESGINRVEFPKDCYFIAQYAFAGCIYLSEIVFNDQIDVIGEEAFSGDMAITSVTLPAGLQRLGTGAFRLCTGLKSADITARLIDDAAFYMCSSLTDVKINEGTRRIGNLAFYDVPITNLTLPESLQSVSIQAFRMYNDKLREGESEEFYIPKGLQNISAGAFECLNIEAFEVSEDNPSYASPGGMLTDISGKRFIACPGGAEGTVVIPDGVYSIENYSFFGCDEVDEVDIPASVSLIEAAAFNGYQYAAADEDRIQVTLLVVKDSPAHLWAMDNNWPFRLKS